MDDDPFVALGVSEDVNEGDLKQAWLRLRGTFDPDLKSDLSDAEKRHFISARERIDQAYARAVASIARRVESVDLSGSTSEVDSDDGHGATAWAPPAFAAEHPDPVSSNHPTVRPLWRGECDFCGSHPAREVHFRQISGRLIFYKATDFQAELCRPCAIATGRKLQNSTLIWGWWGAIALFRNLYVIFKNATELSRVKTFEGIDSRDPLADAPLDDPLSPGRALHLRFGAVVTLGLGLAIAGSLIASELHPTPTMEVGGCVKGSFRVEPTSCDSSDVSGRIVGFKTRAEGCPDRADSYVETTGGVWCIDDR